MSRGTRGIAGLTVAVGCALALVAAPSAQASSTGNPGTGTSFSSSTSFDQVAQTFTVPAGTDNFLFRFTFLGVRNNVAATPTIQATVAGKPAGPALWTGPAIPTSAASRQYILYPNLTVTPGQSYALILTNEGNLTFLGTNDASYPQGQMYARNPPPPADSWGSFPTFDWGFLAEFNAGLAATDTTVTCSPNPVPLLSPTTCTATVTNAGSGPAGPSGDVTFTGGSSSPSCTLTAGSCSAQVQRGSTGTLPINANYAGDATHLSSTGIFQLTATSRATTTTVACTPTSPAVGQASNCTATVADTDAGTQSTPAGSMNLTATGAGALSSPNCGLVSGSCVFTYTPSAAGPSTITAVYIPGNVVHSTSTGDETLSALTPSGPPLPIPTPTSQALEPVDPCAAVTGKLDRLTKKLKRQQSGADDSKKKARKRAKIRKNIQDTKKRRRNRC